MRIGVWLGVNIIPSLGGSASYMSRLTRLIDGFLFDSEVEVCFISVVPQYGFQKDVILINIVPKFLFQMFKHNVFMFRLLGKINKLWIRLVGLKSLLKEHEVAIVYYISQNYCFDESFPFIATNWDIGHRSTHSFPEVIGGGQYKKREDYYRNILPQALMIICESEAGKEELIRYTNIGEHKIRVMPMFAGAVSRCACPENQQTEILERIGINDSSFFFYPAQFWAHKNHFGVLKAFKLFIDRHKDNYKLIFCGSDNGNLNYIKKLSNDWGLGDQVLFLGFVSEETVYTLYNNAISLIMASHFGPTNMPPIEAMEIGCPVICSDLKGHREILGNAAIYFNSFDENSILNAMEEVIKNRVFYVSQMKIQQEQTIFKSEESIKCLNKILTEASNIRRNWE